MRDETENQIRIDRVIAVDWSARSTPSPRTPSRDAIWVCESSAGTIGHPAYHRTRDAAIAALCASLEAALERRERVLLGCDFAFGFPSGFAEALTGRQGALAVWDWLADAIEDRSDNANNRFDVAAAVNRRFPGVGPFWGRPAQLDLPDLPAKGRQRHGNALGERRAAERTARGAHPVWKLYTTGAVGSQTLVGVPRLAALRRRFGAALAVWPLETGWRMPDAPIILVEIYPGLWRHDDLTPLIARHPREGYHVADARQVRAVVQRIAALPPRALARAFDAPPGLADAERVAREEGWIFGLGIGDADR